MRAPTAANCTPSPRRMRPVIWSSVLRPGCLPIITAPRRGNCPQAVCGRLPRPARADQTPHPRVLARQVLGPDRRRAGDAELLQVAVVDKSERLTRARAVEVEQAAELAVGRARHADLAQVVAALDIGDD